MRRLLPVLALLLACGKEPRDEAALRDPSRAKARAPATFRVRFETTKGDFLVDVYRDWAPHGVDRFWNLVRAGFYDGSPFHRVTPDLVQFGLTADPETDLAWLEAFLPKDPPKQSNRRGFLSFAQAGGLPEKRTTQVFINRDDNTSLDRKYPPIGQVVGSGMDVVNAIYAAGDGAPDGPVPGRIIREGKAYLAKEFPRLDYVRRASLVE